MYSFYHSIEILVFDKNHFYHQNCELVKYLQTYLYLSARLSFLKRRILQAKFYFFYFDCKLDIIYRISVAYTLQSLHCKQIYNYLKDMIQQGFNTWGRPGCNYQGMSGFTSVDYSKGWNPNIHDQLLRNNIDFIYQKYDTNCSGHLEGHEFFNAYTELCLRMGLCPPQNYQEFLNAVRAVDTNMDGRVSKMELFTLFKRLQFQNSGVNTGNMNGWHL